MHEILPRLSPDGAMLYFTTASGGVWDNWQVPVQPICDSNGDGQVDGKDVLCMDAEGRLMTELASPEPNSDPLQSETVIDDGLWHRVGLIWDGLNRRLCVDDAVVAEDAQDGLGGSGNGMYIGTGKAMEPGTFFSGMIDDVRIYNRAVHP